MTTDYTPEVVIYPFHGRWSGEDALYHARCARHERFTPCGTLTEIGREVEQHLELHVFATEVKPDPLNAWFRKIGTQLSDEDYEEGIRLLNDAQRSAAHG